MSWEGSFQTSCDQSCWNFQVSKSGVMPVTPCSITCDVTVVHSIVLCQLEGLTGPSLLIEMNCQLSLAYLSLTGFQIRCPVCRNKCQCLWPDQTEYWLLSLLVPRLACFQSAGWPTNTNEWIKADGVIIPAAASHPIPCSKLFLLKCVLLLLVLLLCSELPVFPFSLRMQVFSVVLDCRTYLKNRPLFVAQLAVQGRKIHATIYGASHGTQDRKLTLSLFVQCLVESQAAVAVFFSLSHYSTYPIWF